MNEYYFVYILTNQNRTVLYTGITSDLERRLWEHRHGLGSGFVWKYRAFRLVHFEAFGCPHLAIAREKHLKKGTRAGKIRLIEKANPEWSDLLPQE